MGLFSRKKRAGNGARVVTIENSIDRGVPDFVRPASAILHVLDHAGGQWPVGELVVDVEPVAATPYRQTLTYARDVDLVSGVVDGYPVPGIVDLDRPERVILLEPPGGPDLPLVEAHLAQARLERDARTAELARRYPTPSVAQLRSMLGGDAPESAYEAARFRAHLMTTAEARALESSVAAAGESWQRANGTLAGQRTGWDHKLFVDAAGCFQHLDNVAPGGGEIDEQILMSMLLAIRQGVEPGLPDPSLVATVVGPWQQVLGPLA